MAIAKVTAEWRITIPKKVRDALGLRGHDQVLFTLEAGRAVMIPIRNKSLKEQRGIFAGIRSSEGWEAERAAGRELAIREALDLDSTADNGV